MSDLWKAAERYSEAVVADIEANQAWEAASRAVDLAFGRMTEASKARRAAENELLELAAKAEVPA